MLIAPVLLALVIRASMSDWPEVIVAASTTVIAPEPTAELELLSTMPVLVELMVASVEVRLTLIRPGLDEAA